MNNENSDLISYLQNTVNNKKNVDIICKNIMKITESKDISLFIYDICNKNYDCFFSTQKKSIFNNDRKINNITLTNVGYTSTDSHTTIMTIPIIQSKEYIGVLCLLNKVLTYKEEDVKYILSYISILELIMSKEQLEMYYKHKLNGELNISKEMFLANMSHEIRTPLNGVIGYNQLLMQTPLTTTQKTYLTSMNQCSIQLMQIINDILDYSKLTSGKMRINKECFSIKELIQNAKNAIDSRLTEKKQKLVTTISGTCPEFIISDRNKITQILINLISNASKFSDINKQIITNFYCTNNELVIDVVDNGIGISESDIKQLFNAFIQIKESTQKEGSGLGLVISKRLAMLLKGDVSVKSVLNQGSTFTATIKYEEYEEYEKYMEKDMDVLKNKTILVVDDNADNRIVLSELLFEWKMQPVICASALEALRMVMAERYNFDIGLIDICMPNTSGSELAKQIKAEKPYLPLIALSSIASYVNTSNFEFKLDKPINKVQLFNVLSRVLVKSSNKLGYIGNKQNIPYSPLIRNKTICENKNVKILIVEDIIYNANLFINMLETFGFKNSTLASNGKIALKKINEAILVDDPYEIMLLDLKMPEMNGYELIEQLEKKSIKNIHIVVITASIMESDVEKCKNIGIKYFLTKPIQINQLKQVFTYLSSCNE